ncbi:MAG: hypothetical protein RLZZ58_1070 [Pseudomonadota bacterium]
MSFTARISADRDPAIADRIESHLPLVRRIAWHVHGRVAGAARIEVEDLIQTGMIALVEAAQNYEDRGHAFATYAGMRVRGAMIDQLRRDATICRSAMARRKELAARAQRLTLELGHPPDAADMAASMGIHIADYHQLVAAADQVREQSIDEVYSDQSMWFADVEEAADDRLARAQLSDALAAAITRLPAREGQILQMYFVDECNLDEIGAILGVGAARVCQIKKVALDKVRAMLVADGLEG